MYFCGYIAAFTIPLDIVNKGNESFKRFTHYTS